MADTGATAIQRKAVTIVAADLVGFSRMMADDEERVVARLRQLRSDVISPAIAAHDGRIIKTMGDGLLIEFVSPLSAVRAAVTVQRMMVRRALDDVPEEPLRFRIGVNHGDVVIDGDDVLGDVVNIAARLESIAPVGGVCISRSVHDEVLDADDFELRSLGPQFVKNIPTPVETWCVDIDGVVAQPSTAIHKDKEQRASVAVLAFENLSDDADQTYLADGIAEDVTTELARFRSLFVIARSSSFAYRGSTVDIRRVARELGVRYVVTGSVRKSADRVRVSAQLIQAELGDQVWTGRWDRELAELFELQDDLTNSIITGLAPELGAHERRLARRKPTANLNAWELAQRGLSQFLTYSPAGYLSAYELLHASAAADPDFALPRALLARWHAVLVFAGRSANPADDIALGLDHGLAAQALDDRMEDSYIGLSLVYSASGRLDESRDALDRAYALNDNNADTYQTETYFHLCHERPDVEAMEHAAEQSILVSPNDPLAWANHWMIAVARWIRDGDIGASIREPLEAACRHPEAEFFVLVAGAVLQRRSGRDNEARRLIERAKEKNPLVSKQLLIDSFHFPTWPALATTIEQDLDAMTDLGLPHS